MANGPAKLLSVEVRMAQLIIFREVIKSFIPTCAVVDCGRLFDPRNGDVSFRTTTFNSRAAYSCNNGFLLVGQTTRVCQSNGEWSGKAPVCKSEQRLCTS